MDWAAWSKGLSGSWWSWSCLVDGVPDAAAAFEAAALYFEDEDAVVGEEDEVDFGSALVVVVGEA